MLQHPSTRGVLETLIRRHFPTPTSGIDMTLFADDPTLPGNSRKRKRGGGGGRALFFEDINDSSGKMDIFSIQVCSLVNSICHFAICCAVTHIPYSQNVGVLKNLRLSTFP